MLTADSGKLKAWEQEARRERRREQLKEWISNEVALSYWINRSEDPTAESRLGKPMDSRVFEGRIGRLLPNARFLTNELGFRVLIVRALRIPYESGLLPEHSIMKRYTEDMPDEDLINGKRRLSRGEDGWRRVTYVGSEQKRGWRTILLRLVAAGFLSPQAVEKVFGTSNSPEWAFRTGRREQQIVPW